MNINFDLFLVLVLFFTISSISITNIFVSGSIFGSLRLKIVKSENKIIKILKLDDLVLCHQCAGFWIGLLTGFIWSYILFENEIFNFNRVKFCIFLFCYGTIISLFSDIIYRLKQYLCDQCG